MDRRFFVYVFVVAAVLFASGFVFAYPNGATITPTANETAGTGTPSSHAAIAGNMTGLEITGYTTTQTWQGYYGNVSGTIQLANGNNDVMYNWSQATAAGEVYASINDTIGWSTISCFNMSERLTAVESLYNIGASDVDGVDETFNLNNHAPFDTANVSFDLGACNNTQLFGPTGAAAFDEVLLDDSSNRTVFASILDDDTSGFDGVTHDFEMLVLEDGHGIDTDVTVYYFYVELG